MDAKRSLEGHTVVVTGTEGLTIGLDSVTMQSDTLVGYDQETHARITFPLSRVEEISYRDLGGAAWRCALAGMAGGATSGAALGLFFGAIFGHWLSRSSGSDLYPIWQPYGDRNLMLSESSLPVKRGFLFQGTSQ